MAGHGMGKIKVLIADGMASDGLDILKACPDLEIDNRKATPADELAKIIGEYECIVVRSATTLTADLIGKAAKMKLVVRAGAGVDNIDVPAATARKLPVMNTASANSLAAAEQTIALMFAMLRQLPQAQASLASGRWDRATFKGYEATGKILGVVGLGNIGRIVAENAVGLGMKVLGYDPMVKTLSQVPGPLSRMDESVRIVRTVDEVAEGCDILTLHVPNCKETANLIDAARSAKMKVRAFATNCAVVGLVDVIPVLPAVEGGMPAGAASSAF